MQPDLVYPSFAKINLTLRINGRRSDGFHDIFTVFQTVGVCDKIKFSHSSGTSVSCDVPGIPTDERNLIVRSIKLLAARCGVKRGIAVELEKTIPSPGGLGGGSSNAAVALLAARRLWNLDLSIDDLALLGGEIGSDVPFFLHGGTAIGTGRGTDIETVPDFEHRFMLIAAADARIDSGEAYRSLGRGDLTKNGAKSILKNYCVEAQGLYSGRFEFQNDFEEVVFRNFPEVKNTADILKNSGANAVFLSGSGPSIVGLFENPETLRLAADSVTEKGGVVCFETQTVSKQSYALRFGL